MINNFSKNLVLIFIINIILLITKLSAENQAQKTVTLQECYLQLYSSHPLALNKNLIIEKEKILTEIIQKGWKPGIQIKSQISGQSDAVPKTERNKYSLQLDIEQLIFDAGQIQSRKSFESENSKNEIIKNEIDLYSLRDKVNQYFFEIALNLQQIEILRLGYEDLKTHLKFIESGIRNGARLKSDALIIKSEMLNIDNEINAKLHNRSVMIKMLSELIGTDYNDSTVFKIMEIDNFSDEKINFEGRSEIKLFNSEIEKLNLFDINNKIKTKPVLYAFSQIGYANPALNMFENKFESYMAAGFRLSWKPIDWGIDDYEKKANNIKKQLIINQRLNFEKNMKINALKIKSDILNILGQIKIDNEQIKIRAEILESIKSQFNNGVINSTDFITNSNALLNARKTLNLHLIQLTYFKIMYKTLKGEEL